MASIRGARTRRSYRPEVEALQALRLLAGAAAAPVSMPIALEPHAIPAASDLDASLLFHGDAWDAALLRTRVSDLIDGAPRDSDPAEIASGLNQLDRYLNRAWYRAGISHQAHDDCSQAVYATLLQTLGRSRFDGLVADVGRSGIRDVLSRETPEGPDFFRAVDTVKKRAQRERVFQPIDALDVAETRPDSQTGADWSGALREVISQSLNPREAALIQATLQGETPAEIALKWGVAPKTVSNEKSRVIQKLREALVAGHSD